MFAAREGHSTLGIPRAVGAEFVGSDAKGIAAGVLFVAPDGDILLLRRASAEENYAGHWALPGGKADEGESATDCALRETREEIGQDIDAKAHGLKVLDQRITPQGMAFNTFAKAVDEKFAPTLNGEHSGFCWAPLDQLPEPLHPAVKATLTDRLDTGAADMTPEDWDGLRSGFAKWTREEEREPEHAADSCLAFDRDSVRRKDKDGRLHIEMSNISKANVCPYRGEEIPGWQELGLDPNHVYQLFRDPEELRKAVPTANNIPLLAEHVPVSAADHKPKIVVGSTGTDATFDGTYVKNSLVFWAQDAIDGVESEEKMQLSSAYHYKPDMTPGTFLGVQYDGVMRDIVFNHVAQVEEGRAGADVVVGDSKLKTKEFDMSKIVLSRKAMMAAGAIRAYLQPKMAADGKLDISGLLKDVTAKNFKAKKPKLAQDIRGGVKLAKDGKLDDLEQLLDMIEETEVTEGADENPDDGTPMTKEQMAKSAKDEAEKAARDKKAARDAKMHGFLQDKGMTAEDIAGFDAMMDDDETAEDGDPESETEEEKAARLKSAKDKKAKDASPEKKPEGVTKAAMDAALKLNTAETEKRVIARLRGVSEATEAVSGWVGKLAMAHDSAEDVYRTALATLGMDAAKLKDMPLAAMQFALEARPKLGEGRRETRMAQDGGNRDGFNSRYPDATKIGFAS